MKEGGKQPRQDPGNAAARRITFTPNDHGKQPPPSDQVDLAREIDGIVHALNDLFADSASEGAFRVFYRSVFGVAQLALQKEPGFDTKTARDQLDTIKKEIVDDVGPRVKSNNIRTQLKWAALVAIPCAAAYLLLRHVPDTGYIGNWLGEIGAERGIVANFMLLWLGSCLGVCLSYVLRKQTLTLDDLVKPESDYLTPVIRLLLTGTLATLLVQLSMLNIVDLSISTYKLSDIGDIHKTNSHLLAFMLGAIFGIGERTLPSKFMDKTKDLVGSGK